MFILSNCRIKLGKSSDYLRLAAVIHTVVVLVLWNSGVCLSLKMIATVLLIGQLGYIGYTHSLFSGTTLVFYDNEWTIHDSRGQVFVYESHRVVLEAGLFFLLELSSVNQRKLMPVFFDQLSKNDYRALKLIEKVR